MEIISMVSNLFFFIVVAIAVSFLIRESAENADQIKTTNEKVEELLNDSSIYERSIEDLYEGYEFLMRASREHAERIYNLEKKIKKLEKELKNK